MSSRRRIFVFLVCMMAGCLPVHNTLAQAVSELIIQEIVIQNDGPGRIDDGYVEAHTAVRIGDEFERPKVNRDVKALLDTGLFSSVTAELESVPAGMKLIYRLANKYRLAERPALKGIDRYRPSKVHSVLELNKGDLVDEQTAAVRANLLEKEYAEDFYPDAEVSWSLDIVDKEAALCRLTYSIDEGKKARVSSVGYVGNDKVSSRTLHRIYRQTKWYNPFSWIRRSRYESEMLEARRHAILKYYREMGYLDAVVPYPGIERDDDGHVRLIFRVSEGPQYRLGKIDLAGSGLNVFPSAELSPLAEAAPDTVASLSEIEGRARQLRDYFGSRGYIDTRVKTILSPQVDGHILNLTYEIQEGDLVSIRNIVIRGNTRTRDKVIRRELLVYPGEVYNEVKVRRSERIVQNLGFFDVVRSDPVRTPLADERDLVLTVEEKRTGQFMVGAGFSSIEKIVGFMEISQANFDLLGWPNFTGGGQKLKVRAEVGSKRNDFEVSFVEPWFMNKKLSFGLDLFQTDFSFTDYDEVRTGGAVTLGKSLPGPNRASLRYRIEDAKIEDIADTNRYVYADSPDEEFFFTSEEDRTRSSMRLTVIHDTRNNPFIPSKGNQVVGFAEVAGGPFGFDTDEIYLGIRSTTYVPLWWNHVFSFRARAEVIEEFGDTDDVPLSDRLFLGGGKTLRGYEFRDVGPKVLPDTAAAEVGSHRPAGGKTLAVGGVEYTVPVFEAIRVAGFFDIGNVWRDAYDLELSSMASSAGVGLRFDLPGFPVRIDRAWSVEPDDDLTDTDKWVLWIGL